MSFVALSAAGSLAAGNEKLPLLLDPGASKSSQNVVYLEQLSSADSSHFSTLQFQIGTRSLNGTTLTGDAYNFYYPKNDSAFALEIGWETTPITFLGSWGVRVDLGYSSHIGNASFADGIPAGPSRLSLLPLTFGLVYLGDYAPIMKWAMPVVELGVGYYTYLQSSDLDGAQRRGGSLAYHATLGIRHNLAWMGTDKTQLMVDYRHIFSPVTGENFSGHSFLLGIVTSL